MIPLFTTIPSGSWNGLAGDPEVLDVQEMEDLHFALVPMLRGPSQ